jgi:shikimate dehydrogenase
MEAMGRYAVIGNPVAHSKSPEIHAQFAAQFGHAMGYERLLAPLDGFAATVRRFMLEGGLGANVTVPFKLQAHDMATTLSERARLAGAVNTLSFKPVENAGKIDGGKAGENTGENAGGIAREIAGDNTDGVGLVRDLVVNAGVALHGKRILLVGAGGAARGVLLPLLFEQPALVVIANRTVSRAVELVDAFAGVEVAQGRLRAASFAALAGQFDVIINATSASLDAELPAIPTVLLKSGTFAYDMMYGAHDTPFLQLARTRGALVRDGLGMLVEQAAESFKIWRGVRPDTAPVYSALRRQISGQAST